MKTYGPVETEVRQACVRLTCDGCGSEADNPGHEAWVWGGVGVVYGHVSLTIWIDGEDLGDSLDLCETCTKDLIAAIRKRRAGAWACGQPSRAVAG